MKIARQGLSGTVVFCSTSPRHRAAQWERLDHQLGQALASCSEGRARRGRVTPVDGLAMSLRRIRATLNTITRNKVVDARAAHAASHVYLFCIRTARELDRISGEHHDAGAETARLLRAASEILGTFDAVLVPALAAVAAAPHVPAWGALRWELDSLRRVLSGPVVAMAA